jgi:pyruvate kinase
LRPLFAPIFAFAPSVEICRRLALNWGIFPHLLPLDADPNRTIRAAEEILLAHDLAKASDHLVVISDLLAGEQRFVSVQLRVVK